MATIDIVKEILSENMDIDPETITEQSTPESLGIDSLDMVELICELEDRCDIDFGEPDGLANMGELCAHIDSLK